MSQPNHHLDHHLNHHNQHRAMASRKEAGQERKILTTANPKRKQHQLQAHRTIAILWAIFLYGLLQIATNLIPAADNPADSSRSFILRKLPTRAPTISKPVAQVQPSSLNDGSLLQLQRDEEADDGCNRRRRRSSSTQLCSSTKTTTTTRHDEALRSSHDDHELSFGVTQTAQRPLFLSASSSRPQAAPSSSVIHSSLLQIFDKLTTSTLQNYIINAAKQLRSLFGGPRVLLAQAAATPTATLQQQQQQPQSDRGIVVLNSTNFSRELLQNRHPFPHIKLIEFYVAYCSFCSKFKSTYTSLAKEIYSWRNVIRPSLIDLGTNLPVAHSWRINTVPTLGVYPPLAQQTASKIDKQIFKMMRTRHESNQDNNQEKSIEDDTQDYLYSEYNAAKPMVLSLEPSTYLDNIPRFKSVLLDYIQSYVRSVSPNSGNSSAPSNYIPETWPNLRPVGEGSLTKLLANHPRQELFLMIQGPAYQSQSQQQQQQQQDDSMAFRVMLELSSTASWKAVRYVKASENRALVEDVILQLKKLSRQPADQINEQVEILENFLMDKPSSASKSNIVLIHTDDSQTLVKMEGSSFAFISAMTGQNLVQAEQHLSSSSSSSSGDSNGSVRSRRDATTNASDQNNNGDLQVELLVKHISHTYTETKEDRKFIRSINGVYRDISMDTEEQQQQQPSTIVEVTTNKASESPIPTSTSLTSSSAQQQQPSSSSSSSSSSSPLPSAPSYTSESSRANYIDDGDDDSADGESSRESIFTKLHNLLFNGDHARPMDPDSSSLASSGDYFDKIKAIRYILFNEIPRASFADKSTPEQQEKLNILLNLVSVIKSYFPMADSSSIQFMDGVHTYLLKQQSKLLSVNNQQQQQQQSSDDQQQQQHRGLVFDTRAFKQELKRLEGEDKRLPEVKEFKHCAKGGYPCALWRLFHTLTAFEYKKLNQIRLIPSAQSPPTSTVLQSQSQQQQQQPAELISSLSNVAPPIPEPMSSISAAAGGTSSTITNSTSMINSPPDLDVPSPGERLVSPPSTTTSLSLTIVGPSSASSSGANNGNQKRITTEADLPTPVLLVMRDYITNFFGCSECAKNFQQESADLSLERIRHQEPAEFSILWLWETHNRVNKRLSVDPATNPPDNPKMWFPSYDKCFKCYKRQPSFLKDQSIAKDGPAAIFYESIEWNRHEVLNFLADEYTKQPMDYSSNLFAHHLRYDYGYILAASLCLLTLVLLVRCSTQYVERQRRHKATLLNGNGAHCTYELH